MPVVPDALTIIVLAAGGGTRLGGGKLLLPWRGKALAAHVVAKAAALERAAAVVVVLGHEAERVRRAVEHSGGEKGKAPIRFVENRGWRDGQGTSLRLGVEAAMADRAARNTLGAMIMLGDLPCVRRSTLSALACAHALAVARDSAHLATAPFHNGERGHPVIVSPSLYPALLGLDGDVGAKRIIAGLGDSLLRVEVDDSGILRDVDTPEDYAALGRHQTDPEFGDTK